MARRPVPPLVGDGLVTRTLVVDAADALFVKAVLEAHEGLANVFGEQGGSLTIAAPVDRASELDAVLAELSEALRRRKRP